MWFLGFLINLILVDFELFLKISDVRICGLFEV